MNSLTKYILVSAASLLAIITLSIFVFNLFTEQDNKADSTKNHNFIRNESNIETISTPVEKTDGLTLEEAFNQTNLGSRMSSRACSRDLNKVIYCVLPREVGKHSVSNILLLRSDNDGKDWSEEIVPTGIYSTNTLPAITIDSQNNIHIVWIGIDLTGYLDKQVFTIEWYEALHKRFNLLHITKTNSNWGNVYKLGDSGGDINPSIALDSRNAIHVVWFNTLNRTLLYRKLSAGVWGATGVLASNINFPRKTATLAVDLQNNIHVVWADDDIYYKEIRDGILEETVDIDTRPEIYIEVPSLFVGAFGDFNPSIAIDSQNNIHIVWISSGLLEGRQAPQEDVIMYQKKDKNGWLEQPINVAYGWDNPQGKPLICLDSRDNIYISWYSYDIYNRGPLRGGTSPRIVSDEFITLPLKQKIPISTCSIWPQKDGVSANIPNYGYEILETENGIPSVFIGTESVQLPEYVDKAGG
ncbi:MAG: hypothetical protein HYS87_02555 [Candidatus Colwellbacteria bacterium]|nr:hypothetical protein [Candidatus Colwellbacteria bacterium]